MYFFFLLYAFMDISLVDHQWSNQTWTYSKLFMKGMHIEFKVNYFYAKLDQKISTFFISTLMNKQPPRGWKSLLCCSPPSMEKVQEDLCKRWPFGLGCLCFRASLTWTSRGSLHAYPRPALTIENIFRHWNLSLYFDLWTQRDPQGFSLLWIMWRMLRSKELISNFIAKVRKWHSTELRLFLWN